MNCENENVKKKKTVLQIRKPIKKISLLQTGNHQEKPPNHHQVAETPLTTTYRNAFLCQEMEQRPRCSKSVEFVFAVWAKEEERLVWVSCAF